MAKKLKVDTTQLSSLGGKLKSVRDKLGNTAAQLAKHDASIGAPTVKKALHDFEDHWGRGRRELKEKADALAQMLIDSADNYVKTDTGASSNLNTNQTTATVGGGH